MVSFILSYIYIFEWVRNISKVIVDDKNHFYDRAHSEKVKIKLI